MSILDFFFGSAPSTEIEQLSRLSEGQQSIEDLLVELFQGDDGSFDFEGERVADLSSIEGLSLAGLEQQALDRVSGQTELQSASTQALLKMLTDGPINFEEFFDRFEAGATKDFQDALAQLDRTNATSKFSSGFAEKEARAFEDFASLLADKRGELGFATELANVEQILAAISAGGNLETNTLNQLIGLQGAGALPRNIEQAKLDAEFQEFLLSQEGSNNRVQQMLQLLGIPTTENIVLNDPGQAGLIPSMLIAAAGGAGTAAGTAAGRGTFSNIGGGSNFIPGGSSSSFDDILKEVISQTGKSGII